MDAGDMISDCNVNEVEEDIHDGGVNGEDGNQAKFANEGTQVSPNDCVGFRKLDVAPAVEGSIGSSCGSQRSKLRLCVEMNIKSKFSGQDVHDEDKCTTVDPVMVRVDYPDDVVVVVNAKIQRLEKDPSLFSENEMDDAGRQVITPEVGHDVVDRDEVTDHNQNKVLNSTFVKVPLSSTQIYPVLEGIETNDAETGNKEMQQEKDFELVEQHVSIRKSGSGDATFYHTVLCDNDGTAGFGNISAIAKTDKENEGKVSEDNISSNNVNLAKNPSTRLNSSNLLFKSEVATPGEKLVKALHVLARYNGVWGIYEDESLIINYLVNLNMILNSTDKATVHKTCKEEDYLEVKGLVSYFALEKRFIIRSELLQTFTLISQKSPSIGLFISASDIPVVLAREIASGDYTISEIYAYASYLHQMISAVDLSESQCERIGEQLQFYGSLCALIIDTEKMRYGPMSEILFDILLHYHYQLGDSDQKWQGLWFAADQNPKTIKKIKQKLMTLVLRNASLNPDYDLSPTTVRGIKQVLLIIHDFIACEATRKLFTDAELDVILVTLIHNLENDCFEFRKEALKTIYRSLIGIKKEPSGLDKLERVVVQLIKDGQSAGDTSYLSILRKIYKITSMSSDM